MKELFALINYINWTRNSRRLSRQFQAAVDRIINENQLEGSVNCDLLSYRIDSLPWSDHAWIIVDCKSRGLEAMMKRNIPEGFYLPGVHDITKSTPWCVSVRYSERPGSIPSF